MLRYSPQVALEDAAHVSPHSGCGYTLRVAVPADREVLADVYVMCRRATFSWLDPAQFQRSDFVEDTEGERVVVCEAAGRIVGFSGTWLPDNFLHHLFVLPEHQGHGAGLALLRASMRDMTGPVRLKCVALNQRAVRFYSKLGGVIEGTSQDGPEGPYHTIRLPNPLPAPA